MLTGQTLYAQQNEEVSRRLADLRAKAENGDAQSQRELGEVFFRGNLGVTKDEVEAVKWYRKAAKQNYAQAQYTLGGCYFDGKGVAKDEAEAVKWYRKAAEQNYAEAQLCLVWCYKQGQGVAKDLVEAYKWASLAASQGDKDAKELRDTLKTKMTPEQIAASRESLTLTSTLTLADPNARFRAAPTPEDNLAQVPAMKATTENNYVPKLRSGEMPSVTVDYAKFGRQAGERRTASLLSQTINDPNAAFRASPSPHVPSEASFQKQTDQFVPLTSGDDVSSTHATAIPPLKPSADSNIGLFCLLGVIGLILAIYGSVLGCTRKIVVYDSKKDLNVTCASIVSWACTGIAFHLNAEAPFVIWVLLPLSIILTFTLVGSSLRANKSAWEGILSVFAKYALLVLIMFSAIIAVAGALATAQGIKQKKYKEATSTAAVGAAGAAGFYFLEQLINDLITKDTSVKRNAPFTVVSPKSSQTPTAVDVPSPTIMSSPIQESARTDNEKGRGVLAALGTVFAAALAANAMEQHSAKCYCKYCGRSFTSLTDLTSNRCSSNPRGSGARHVPYGGIENSPYHCQYCGRSFTSLTDLTSNRCSSNPQGSGARHVPYEGHDQSPYHCQYCGRSFTSLTDLTSNRCSSNPQGSGARHVPM